MLAVKENVKVRCCEATTRTWRQSPANRVTETEFCECKRLGGLRPGLAWPRWPADRQSQAYTAIYSLGGSQHQSPENLTNKSEHIFYQSNIDKYFIWMVRCYDNVILKIAHVSCNFSVLCPVCYSCVVLGSGARAGLLQSPVLLQHIFLCSASKQQQISEDILL